MIKQILSEELHAMLKDNDPVIIDVREPGEYYAARIANSKHIPVDKFEDYIKKHPMDKDLNYVMVCKAGVRSLYAAQVMTKHGYKHVSNLEDGLAGWVHNGFEIEQD